jgi:predicted small secreted protein
MRRRLAAVLLGLSGLLAACATTVEGTGTVAADAVKPTGTGKASPTPSPSAGASARPGRTTLKCSGEVISPSGAPYCFTAPAGFQDVSSSVTVDASIGREKYRSAVAVAARDLIIVTVYELPVDTDPIADATLEGELKTVLGQLAQQGFTFESSTAERGTVDGARSFRYHASQEKEMLESDVYFLFRGKNEIQVNCQWKEKQAEIERGCRAVLDSLQFKSVK